MTDKKLTDKEIIKALECLCGGGDSCTECTYHRRYRFGECRKQVAKDVLDLIIRLQSENKRLGKEVNLVSIQFQDLQERYEEAQAEIESLKIFRGYAEKRASDYKTMRDKYLNAKSKAYKEFAERLKEFMHNKFKALDEYEFEYITERDINNLVKEITEDSEINE